MTPPLHPLRGALLLIITLMVGSAPLSASAKDAGSEIFNDTRGDVTIDQDTLDEAEVAFLDGLTAFRAKRYEEAAKQFKKAHQLVPFRDLLFNVARAYEELKDKGNAITYYKLYLKTKPIDETQIIRRLRQLGVKDFRKSQRSSGGGGSQRSPTSQAPDLSAPSNDKVLTWSALGGGLVLIGLGSYFGIDALGQAEQARETTSEKRYEDYKGGAEGSALFADISISLGVLAIAGGVYLLLTQPSQATPSAQGQLGVTSAPAPSQPLRWNVQMNGDSAGLGLSGSF